MMAVSDRSALLSCRRHQGSLARCRPARISASIAIAAVMVTAACGPSQQAQTDASAVDATDSLAKMEVAFEGNHRRADIQRQIDRALTLYGSEVTEENRGRAGSTVVALRRKTGVPEMRILDHMIRSHVPGVSLTFPEAAGYSAAALGSGDK